MGEEQLKILNMLKDGTVTVEEAERLLGLVGSSSAGERRSGEFAEFAREIPDATVRAIKEALKAAGEAGRIVGKKGKDLFDAGSDRFRKKYRERPFKVRMPEGLAEAKVMLEAKVGSVKISGAHDETDYLASGEHKSLTGEGVEFVLQPDDATKGVLSLEGEAGTLDGKLHPGITYDFDVENAAGSVRLDLTKLRVKRAVVENICGITVIKLGASLPEVSLEIANSAGKVKLVVPKESGVSIDVCGQMGAHNLDEIGLARDGEKFVSDGFPDAANKVVVSIQQTVGAFKLKRH
jgi:hypothetical protein